MRMRATAIQAGESCRRARRERGIRTQEQFTAGICFVLADGHVHAARMAQGAIGCWAQGQRGLSASSACEGGVT